MKLLLQSLLLVCGIKAACSFTFITPLHLPTTAAAAYHGRNNQLKQAPHSCTMTAEATPAVAAPDPVIDKFKKYVMTTYGRYALTIVSGKGCKLTSAEGKEHLDFVAGISTCALGHGHPALTKAISDQMATLHHVSNLYYIPNQANLANWLVDHSCADKVFFCNSGAEANEAALKLARKYAHTKLGLDEPVIITAKDSFHGRTLATITATGQPKYQKNFEPLMPGFKYVELNNVDELRKTVKRINRVGKLKSLLPFGKRCGVAAILMEPLQGEGGVRPATKKFFKAIRDICDETGALMMCDEVQTGMGRTGMLWGYENLEVEPDVFTSAKALGGGVPIGAMLCKEKANVFGPGEHASTFGGNPLACAAGMAVANELENSGVMENVQQRSSQLIAGLKALVVKYPKILDTVRGWGLIIGLVIQENTPLLAGQVVAAAAENGLLLVPAGLKVVRFVPPLIVSEEEVKEALAILEKSVVAANAKAMAAAA